MWKCSFCDTTHEDDDAKICELCSHPRVIEKSYEVIKKETTKIRETPTSKPSTIKITTPVKSSTTLKTAPKKGTNYTWIVIPVLLIFFCFFIGIISLPGLLTPLTQDPNTIISRNLTATRTPTKKSPTITSTSRPIQPTKTPKNTATRTKIPSPTKTRTSTRSSTDDIWKDCTASYKSRLNVGDIAYLSSTPNLRNRVRIMPYLDREIIGYIDPGEEVEIIKGPSCSNLWVWWKVRSLETGLVGWTAEGDENNYWLIPK